MLAHATNYEAPCFIHIAIYIYTSLSRCITTTIIFWMASGVGVEVEHHVTLTLTEDDIPGASLREPFERHTVAELRWWLLCRGITVPASWKKVQIVRR